MNNKQKIYFFSQLQTDGDQNMVDILGGKGANIAEMCKLGLPVPPGFTLATSLCSDYLKNKTLATNLKNNIKKNIAKTEGVIKKEFGGSNPLLLSVRSGAPVSMPGMMETILNIGLTSKTIPFMIKPSKNEGFVYDSYRRLIMMYADVVMEKALGLNSSSVPIRELMEKVGDVKDPYVGFEQEYFFTDENGEPLGWEDGEPRPQGDYYCGVGSGNVEGREISELHLEACLEAGIELTGTNAEVALGQWEYQCFGKGIKAADDLWVSRYLLYKIAEDFGVGVNIHPKPKTGDWNGSGMHTNFSNEQMRTNGTEELYTSLCEKLGTVHKDAISSYGSDNDMRLTGLHETQSIDKFSYGVSDRGASIRIPIYTVEHNWNGYLEDRRPASNADPYKILSHIVGTLG